MICCLTCSARLLHGAFISTFTACCIHQYNCACIGQYNYDYCILSTFTACCIDQYIYCVVHSSVHGTPSGSPGGTRERYQSFLRRERIAGELSPCVTNLLEISCSYYAGFAVTVVTCDWGKVDMPQRCVSDSHFGAQWIFRPRMDRAASLRQIIDVMELTHRRM